MMILLKVQMNWLDFEGRGQGQGRYKVKREKLRDPISPERLEVMQ